MKRVYSEVMEACWQARAAAVCDLGQYCLCARSSGGALHRARAALE